MYALLLISIVLAALLTINALATLLSAAVWRLVARRAQNWAAETRVQIIFALRIFPALGAIASVLALLMPSYIKHEPFSTNETVGVKLAALAFISAVGIALALWRGIAAWRSTRRLLAAWLRHAEPLHLDSIRIPSYRIRHPFPVVAVVGGFRPKLFIASQIFDALSADEMAAALVHERGHLATYDNIKRGLLRACRDVLTIVPCGRSLDRAWADASEAAADEHAAREGADVALDLASALVKIARIIPTGAKPTMPAFAFLVGEDACGISGRVRHLTELASPDYVMPAHSAYTTPLLLWSGMCALVLVLTLTATDSAMLWIMHQAIERVVLTLS